MDRQEIESVFRRIDRACEGIRHYNLESSRKTALNMWAFIDNIYNEYPHVKHGNRIASQGYREFKGMKHTLEKTDDLVTLWGCVDKMNYFCKILYTKLSGELP